MKELQIGAKKFQPAPKPKQKQELMPGEFEKMLQTPLKMAKFKTLENVLSKEERDNKTIKFSYCFHGFFPKMI